MRNLQETYNELLENKKIQKEIRREYKEALSDATEYEETEEKLKELKEKKKQIETMTQARLASRWDEYEKLKAQAQEISQMLTDIALNDLLAGKKVALKDQYENDYEPVYKIAFRKIN